MYTKSSFPKSDSLSAIKKRICNANVKFIVFLERAFSITNISVELFSKIESVISERGIGIATSILGLTLIELFICIIVK